MIVANALGINFGSIIKHLNKRIKNGKLMKNKTIKFEPPPSATLTKRKSFIIK